ncbi:hypothetical protein K8I28_06640 [bacterium]|nr:hypothetical protein [bacterium]
MRSSLRWLRSIGMTLADRYEHNRRSETLQNEGKIQRWLEDYDHFYDLVINGGDNALPLTNHYARIEASEIVWQRQLQRYGESKYLALTGNHELGHGHDPDPDSYPEFMELRASMFDRPVNRNGYGWEHHNGVTLLVLDSELIYLQRIAPRNNLISYHSRKMFECLQQAIKQDYPIALFTHNTLRVSQYLRSKNLRSSIIDGERQVVLVGGHFHTQRTVRRNGIDILWSGGASYAEPMMNRLAKVPFTGLRSGGTGGIELTLQPSGINARHQMFDIVMDRLKIAA